MQREPLITVGTLTAAISAIVSCLVAFGLPLTDDQQSAILGLAAVLGPVAVALIGRRLVTPVDAAPRDEDGNAGLGDVLTLALIVLVVVVVLVLLGVVKGV